jgi:hypothetical protein
MKFRSVAAAEMSTLRNVMLPRNRLERKRNLQKGTTKESAAADARGTFGNGIRSIRLT